MGNLNYEQKLNTRNIFLYSYGLEVVTPLEVVVSMHRAKHNNQERNNDEWRRDLDMAEERS